MTILLRIILIIASAGTFALVMQKIRKSTMQIDDAVFWVLLCTMLLVFAVFPKTADLLAHLLGIYSTANFLFLFIIFILMMKVFSLSVKLSQLEKRLRDMAQEQALSGAVKPKADSQNQSEKALNSLAEGQKEEL